MERMLPASGIVMFTEDFRKFTFPILEVYLLDKRFVDPRRPRGPPTKDEQADILPPYNEELMFIPTGFATHKQIIEGLAGSF